MSQNIDTALMLRMETSLAKFEKQMARATQVGSKTAVDLEKRFDKMGSRMATSSTKAASGLGKIVQIGGAGRFVMQNTAAQLGDIAVQLEMGTSASRVMSQQLPQLLGGFGALGGALGIVAPLLGTVAAVGIPLAAMFFTLGGDSEKAAEKVKTFAEKLDAVRSALGRAESAMAAASAGGIEDLYKKYGKVTVAVSELADALADIEKRAARLEIGNLMDGLFDKSYEDQIGKLFGAVGQAMVGSTQEQVDEAKRLIAKTQADIEARQGQGVFVSQSEIDDLAMMRNELAVLQGDLANAGDLAGEIKLPPELLTDIATFEAKMRDAVAAGDFTGAKDAIEAMRRGLVDAGMTIEDDVYRRVVEVEDVVREAANRFADAEVNASGVARAAGGISGPVGAAADEAARLSGNLAGALAQLAGIASGIATANRLASQAAQRRIEFAGDPVGLAGADTQADVQEQTGALAYAAIRSGSSSTLSKIASTTTGLAAGAMAAAELEQNAKAAEAAAAAAVKAAAGDGKSKGGGGKSKTETSMFASSEAQIQSLQRQIEMIGKTRAEIAELTARYGLLDEAKRRGIEVTDELTQRINTEAAEVGRLAGEYEAAQDQIAALEDLNKSFKDSIIDAAMGGANAFDSFKEAIKRAAIEYALFGTGSFAGGGSGSGGGLLGSALGGLFGGFRATGGPVSGGKTYMVGERGPELFTPPGTGQIIPNNKLGGGSGSTNVTQNIIVSGATGNSEIRQMVAQGVQQGNAQIRREVPGIMKQHTKVAG